MFLDLKPRKDTKGKMFTIAPLPIEPSELEKERDLHLSTDLSP